MIKADPRNFIAQPLVEISRAPAFVPDANGFEGRHIDLRPYILMGEEITIIPGGLTPCRSSQRLPTSSTSSQGGGSKDTWVLARPSGMSQSQTMGSMTQSQGFGEGETRPVEGAVKV